MIYLSFMKRATAFSLLLLTLQPAVAQTSPAVAQTHRMERLDRGLVAYRIGQQVMVSWRLLGDDGQQKAFDVFRNGVKLNTAPLTGGTCFVDEHPLSTAATYTVDGTSYVLPADGPDGCIRFPLNKPEARQQADDSNRLVPYSANDCSVGDVDGDGRYELFVKWEPRNAHDNSHLGFTNPTLIDCYTLEGKFLWRIDLGRNIRSGAHYVPYIVCDFDGDGRAELMVKTADGTIDGKGKVIGDAQADWNEYGDVKTHGRALHGPEYLTVFSGATGEALATVDYVPARGDIMTWGDNYGNRSERYLAAMAWVPAPAGLSHDNGATATTKGAWAGVFCRGYYARTALTAWTWDGKQLRQAWAYDSGEGFHGQGNHNLRVGDVDHDGFDEITYGAMAFDHDGTVLYNTGLGHGDALHQGYFLPDARDQMVWDCHEEIGPGSEMRNARTGEIIFQIPANFDVGRCMAADIDSTNAGVEMWSLNTPGIMNVKGECIARHEDVKGLSCNFGVWWDGDLCRELLDHERVTKYEPATKTFRTLKRFDQRFNNSTKSNPCLSADILGDWREEVMTYDPAQNLFYIHLTPHPTPHRIPCLMLDPSYRSSVAAENVGYNQPPETGFYLGTK